jgi:hypothetical protein
MRLHLAWRFECEARATCPVPPEKARRHRPLQKLVSGSVNEIAERYDWISETWRDASDVPVPPERPGRHWPLHKRVSRSVSEVVERNDWTFET